jgi:hypothetical protein
MSECSLRFVNEAECHSSIRDGTCPGLDQQKCVNTDAIDRLKERRYLSGVDRAGQLRYAYYDSSKVTLAHVYFFMKRAKKS